MPGTPTPASTAKFRVRRLFVDRAILPAFLASGLRYGTLKRIASYVKNKTSCSGLTFGQVRTGSDQVRTSHSASNPQQLMLSYKLWQHIACEKIGLPVQVAWLYYSTFLMLEDECTTACSGEPDANLHVPLSQFLVFLFCQQVNRVSLRTSFNTGDIWPSTEANIEQEFEDKLVIFLADKIRDLLDILSVIDSNNNTVGAVPSQKQTTSAKHRRPLQIGLSREAVSGLSILLEPVVELLTTPQKDVSSNASCRFLSAFDACVGNNKGSSSHQFYYNFDQIIRFGLTTSSSCRISSEARGFAPVIKTNFKIAPTPAHRLVLFANIRNRTKAKDSTGLRMVFVQIVNCRDSYLYILQTIRDVCIEACSSTTCVFGPVAGVVNVVSCRNVSVHVVCRRLMITNCQNCTFYIHSTSAPVLFGHKNEQLVFAPFNVVNYAHISEQCSAIGLKLSCENQFWSRPVLFSDQQQTAKQQPKSEDKPASKPETTTCWMVMNAQEFGHFVVPFTGSSVVLTNPEPKVVENNNNGKIDCNSYSLAPDWLPELYAKAVLKKQEKFVSFRQQLKLLERLAPAVRSEIEAALAADFERWLELTGNRRQVAQLEELSNRKMSA